MEEAVFLSHDVADHASMSEYVDAVRNGYRQRGEGAPTKPRTSLKSEGLNGLLTTYITMLPDTGVMGGYVYDSGFSDDDARFVTPLFDAESGKVLAILDGASMNPFKTGAAGGAAIDALAREDASTLGIIGSGAQARGQLRGAVEVREFDEVTVFSPTQSHRERFATEMSEALGVDVTPVDSSGAAAADADVLITATNTSEPVVAAEDIEPGTHINAIGVYDPEKRELNTETVANATYVPDLRERLHQDSGEFLIPLEEGAITEDHVHGELGEVIAGVVPGRQRDDELTIFDSGGTAIETVASAAMLYRKAADRGLGTELRFSSANETFTEYDASHRDVSE